jgi:Domain of unknown function (DUF1883)
MNFIHSREYLDRGDVVVLNCDTQCNFMITTDSDFSSYRCGGSFRYYGGHYTCFPARIGVPHTDNWNITIDLGEGAANIRYNLEIIRAARV